MTNLAIVGGGIAGRSLIYALAKKQKTYSEIVLFDSDNFSHACSRRSTAIVAPRGVSSGHSELGDLLIDAFQTFSQHVQSDRPQGVFPIIQYTGAFSKLDQFQKRYPNGKVEKAFPAFSLSAEVYTATESGFLIDPDLYLNWLTQATSFTHKQDFVIKLEEVHHQIRLTTQKGQELLFDHVIFCGGAANRFWQHKKVGKPVQGSYLEFSHDLGAESFSLTLEGDNLIYHAHSKKLLMGSTTSDLSHESAPMDKLRQIYERLAQRVALTLPEFLEGKVMVGLREKAAKRTPYLFSEGRITYLGGFYKNGYSLALHLSNKLIETLQ